MRRMAKFGTSCTVTCIREIFDWNTSSCVLQFLQGEVVTSIRKGVSPKRKFSKVKNSKNFYKFFRLCANGSFLLSEPDRSGFKKTTYGRSICFISTTIRWFFGNTTKQLSFWSVFDHGGCRVGLNRRGDWTEPLTCAFAYLRFALSFAYLFFVNLLATLANQFIWC